MTENNVERSGAWWKIGLVILLIVVAVIITTKKHSTQSPPTAATGINQTGTTNPLDQAFKTGRVVLADFGRGICIPCKMMKPILDELAITYRGKAEILILDIDEYPDLTEQSGIRLIPTQIFFDKSGKEVWRHEGFLAKNKIVAKLKELGVD